MILQPPPDSPLLLRWAADAALVLHIGGGGMGILSGFATLALRKGSRAHRVAGQVFLGSMLVMAVIGGSVAALFPMRISVVSGLLTVYLVLTGWRAARTGEAMARRWERLVPVIAFAIAGADLVFGLQAAGSPTGRLDGIPAAPHFRFAAIAALAGAFDVKALYRGLRANQRVARHLWRMCVALQIACSSFFRGQEQVFPRALWGSPLLLVPEITVLAVMLFWLVRLWLRASPPAGAVAKPSPP